MELNGINAPGSDGLHLLFLRSDSSDSGHINVENITLAFTVRVCCSNIFNPCENTSGILFRSPVFSFEEGHKWSCKNTITTHQLIPGQQKQTAGGTTGQLHLWRKTDSRHIGSGALQANNWMGRLGLEVKQTQSIFGNLEE